MRFVMKAGRNEILATVIVCALALTATAPANAQIGGVTSGDAIGIGIAVGAIGAGIGIGIKKLSRPAAGTPATSKPMPLWEK